MILDEIKKEVIDLGNQADNDLKDIFKEILKQC